MSASRTIEHSFQAAAFLGLIIGVVLCVFYAEFSLIKVLLSPPKGFLIGEAIVIGLGSLAIYISTGKRSCRDEQETDYRQIEVMDWTQ